MKIFASNTAISTLFPQYFGYFSLTRLMQGGIQVYSIETSASYTDAGTRGRIATILRHEKRTSHTHLIVLECPPLLTLFMPSVELLSKMESSTYTQITHTQVNCNSYLSLFPMISRPFCNTSLFLPKNAVYAKYLLKH